MTRIRTTEALVLKTYDIGDADRFCILLTASDGRVTAVAKGARNLTSRLAGAVQSFQHLRVDLAEHSSGFYMRSAECIRSFDQIRVDIQRFALAHRASELLLHFLHDTEPQESIFDLAREFFTLCDAERCSLLFPTFQLMLMKELGLLPVFDGAPYSSELCAYLRARSALAERRKISLAEGDHKELSRLCEELLREHLSFPLRSKGALIHAL